MNSAPTALIAEDEPLLAAHLRAELARLWPELQVVAQAGDGQTALEALLAQQPQIAFLDIRMPGLSGLEVAEALAEEWPTEDAGRFPLLVFVTAYDQYALQAFEQQAVDYLLKPVQPDRLADCLRRLRQRLQRWPHPTVPASSAVVSAPAPSDPQVLNQVLDQLRALLGPQAAAAPPPRLEVIQAQVGNAVHLVPVDEVLYFEAADKYLRVVTAERDHLIRGSLRELLPQLDAQRFWQIHRGTVVQIRAVHSALRDETGRVQLRLRDRPERLIVSRLHAARFKGM
ncbi:MAG: LytTR family DNA-binding domain-containing protein [Burkholderiaceae bacterium]|nr:LytTR family DNA-binding domain-containing protein [Burkholderiaceae bacterium]